MVGGTSNVTRVRRLMVIEARPFSKLRTVTCCANQHTQHMPVLTDLNDTISNVTVSS